MATKTTQSNITDPGRVTPQDIRDILHLRRVDPYGIFDIVTSAVEGPNFQEDVDTKIDEINARLANGDNPVPGLSNGEMESARVSGSGRVREVIMNIGSGFGTRQTEELSGYFNLLQTVDMSLAVPYLSVEFYDLRLYEYLKSLDDFDENDRARLFQLSRFLSMADFQTPQIFDVGTNIQRLITSASTEGTARQGITTNAMRTFPSDILNVIRQKFQSSEFQSDEDAGISDLAKNVFSALNDEFGVKSLNDLMAPFVSLVDMEIETTEAAAFIDYFTGVITIKMHDIKFMPLLQQFLQPNRTRVRVTYGWNHPNHRTIAGTLLNLKMTYDANIYDFKVGFDDNLEATFTLKFTSGSFQNLSRSSFLRPDMISGNIVRSDDVRNEVTRLEQLLAEIRSERAQALESIGGAGEETNITTALNASTSVSAFLALASNTEDEFDAANPDFSDTVTVGRPIDASLVGKLREALAIAASVSAQIPDLAREIVNSIWARGCVAQILASDSNTSANSVQMREHFERFTSTVNAGIRASRLQSLKEILSQSGNGLGQEYAPLSEIMNGLYFNGLYRGAPGGFSEGEGVEANGAEGATALYFRANPQAGLFSRMPLSYFLISKEEFKTAYENYMKQTGKIDMSIIDLLQTVMSSFFANRANPNYGLSAFFEQSEDGENVSSALRADIRTQEDLRRKIESFGLSQDVAAQIEQSFSFSDTGTGVHFILIQPKLLIIDRRTLVSTNQFQEDVLATSQDELMDGPTQNIFMFYDYNDDNSARGRVEMQFLKNLTDTIGRDTSITPDLRLRMKREAASQIFPTIRAKKSNTSIIRSLNVGLSDGDALLETILMTQNGYGVSDGIFQSPGTAADQFGNGFSFYRRPTVSMDVMGIPRVQPHQHFFVDFDSGTNLDNIYFLQKIKHKVEKDDFTTSLEFTFTETLRTSEIEEADSNTTTTSDPSDGDADTGTPSSRSGGGGGGAGSRVPDDFEGPLPTQEELEDAPGVGGGDSFNGAFGIYRYLSSNLAGRPAESIQSEPVLYSSEPTDVAAYQPEPNYGSTEADTTSTSGRRLI